MPETYTETDPLRQSGRGGILCATGRRRRGGIRDQGCLCVRPSVSSVCPSVTSDKVHVRPISKYSSIFEHIEHILENIHRICPLCPIPNRQNRPSVRPSRPSTTSLPPNTSDKTTLSAIYQVQPTYGRGKASQLPIRPSVMANRNYHVGPSQGTNFNNPVRFSNYGDRQLGCCFICGDPNHYANTCPHRGPGQGAPLILPCRNCQEYGHQEGQCPKSVQPRPVYK
jgi:hypothetical protein